MKNPIEKSLEIAKKALNLPNNAQTDHKRLKEALYQIERETKNISENLITILEIARCALGDPQAYLSIAEELDLSDEEMDNIALKLETYLNPEA